MAAIRHRVGCPRVDNADSMEKRSLSISTIDMADITAASVKFY
ncbi:hypothetical protein [Metapseudomonas otitidis]|nr:hypothetical protein [Pseudomonas otitidis]